MNSGSKGALVLVWLLAALAGTVGAAGNGANRRPAGGPPVDDLSASATTASQKTSSTTLKSVSESERRSQPDGSHRKAHGTPPARARLGRRDGQMGANLPELTLEEDSSESYLSDDTTLDSKGNPTLSSVLGDDAHTLTSTPEYESDGSEIVDSLNEATSSSPVSSSAQQQVASATNQLKAQQQQIAQLRSQLAASNTQMSLQRPAAGAVRATNQPAPAARSQHHTLLADARHLLMAARQPVSLAGAQQHQQPFPTQPSTFNLNMGADRMMIKQQPRSRLEHQELATESIQHELMSRDLPNGAHLLDHDRRQAELIYAAAAAAAAGNGLDGQQPGSASTYGDAHASVAHQPATCYSPLALLMVILTTMLVTLLACLLTHLLIKHLSRHQFDLIANSKHFETKHGFGSPERRHFNQGSRASLWAAGSARDGQSRTSSVLNMLINQRSADNQSPKQQQQQQQQSGCAFDNPYFREESWTGGRGTAAGAAQPATESPVSAASGATAKLKPDSSWASSASPSSDHLNFIESHISNLHSRQVTSSVKELSVLNHSPRVVDLTDDQQRARVIADPKEGDLVAVDISGHDFMGLGFDVCGNQQQGIFVRSVLSRGPARDSGCIHPGDRLKCINISFDQMTLQDACDILNSGSPYKLRLLIEKRVAPPKLADKFRQTAPILLKRNNRCQTSHLLSQQHYLNGANLNNSGHFTGFFNFKSCLRRLTDIFTPSAKRHFNSCNGATGSANPAALDYRTSQFGVRSPVAGGSEFLEQHQPPPLYLGSAAARRHFPQTRPDSASLFSSHMNADYPGAGSGHLADTDDEEAVFGAAKPAGAGAAHTRGYLESSSASSVNVATAGANQRLNKLTSQDLAAKQHHSHQQTGSADTLAATKRSHPAAANHLHQPASSTAHQAPPVRRQSLAALSETTSQALGQQTYLEQTQSQPEMSSQPHKMLHSDTFARAGKLPPGDRRSGDDARRNKS